MNKHATERTSVSLLLGSPVLDAGGAVFGRLMEFAVDPAGDMHRVQAVLVRRRGGAPMLVPVAALERDQECRLRLGAAAAMTALDSQPGYLLLERDVLDQQIIDVNGHKVVRVNDVDLVWMPPCEGETGLGLRIAEVEVGMRGAVRRLLHGLPVGLVTGVALRLKPSVIPWEFVDLIERDPARRVKLKIEGDRLSRMHPSDIAEILEDLAPAERQALFDSLDDEVAAEALEEVEPKLQQALLASLDSEHIAGIVEEMDPGAAADLLGELPEEQSEAILHEMDPEERHDVEELLEFPSESAAGRMTTQFVALGTEAAVVDAVLALRAFEGDVESVMDIFLVDEGGRLTTVVPLVKLLLARGGDALQGLSDGHVVSCHAGANPRKVAELFDKYNLRSLPVVDEQRRLVGVIHAEQVIALLRGKR